MSSKTKPHRPLAPLALLLAWLVPGAGHVYVGRVGRGIVIFLTVSATFWAGVAMGGIMTVDHRNERWWFAAEMLTGVHGLVSWQRTQFAYRHIGESEPLVVSVPQNMDPAVYRQNLTDAKLKGENLVLVDPVATVARAYAGIAGLLNLLCIFDAAILAMIGIAGEPPPQTDPRPEEAAA